MANKINAHDFIEKFHELRRSDQTAVLAYLYGSLVYSGELGTIENVWNLVESLGKIEEAN